MHITHSVDIRKIFPLNDVVLLEWGPTTWGFWGGQSIRIDPDYAKQALQAERIVCSNTRNCSFLALPADLSSSRARVWAGTGTRCWCSVRLVVRSSIVGDLHLRGLEIHVVGPGTREIPFDSVGIQINKDNHGNCDDVVY